MCLRVLLSLPSVAVCGCLWLSVAVCGCVPGTFCTVGAPEKPMQISAFSLIFAQLNFTASLIGSRKEIEEMLEFSAKHNIRPVIQKMPMRDVNKGIQSVRDGTVRFRVVLENSAPGRE
jgi:D-arabinose 1-dehydrogenase-like Zn-dependent alcohol dehydrogenase